VQNLESLKRFSGGAEVRGVHSTLDGDFCVTFGGDGHADDVLGVGRNQDALRDDAADVRGGDVGEGGVNHDRSCLQGFVFGVWVSPYMILNQKTTQFECQKTGKVGVTPPGSDSSYQVQGGACKRTAPPCFNWQGCSK